MLQHNKIRLKEIAELARVSQSTVSRVLSSHPYVGASTRQAVLAAMRELGIHDSVTATHSTHDAFQITVVSRTASVSTNSEDVFRGELNRGVAEGVEAACRAAGWAFRMEMGTLQGDEVERWAAAGALGGLLFVGGVIDPALIRQLSARRVPLVVTAAHLSGVGVNSISADYTGGARAAIAYLLAQGHRRIALVNGMEATATSAEKLDGYRLAHLDASMSYTNEAIVSASDFSAIAGYDATRTLLARDVSVTAILYAADALAVGGMKALREAGCSIPGDISVIGFYDEAMAQYTDPPLTSVRIERRKIGEIAARRLHEILQQKDRLSEPLRIVTPTTLVHRASVARVV